MAGGGEENVTEIVINDEAHDFRSLLSSSEREFLVRNNGDQVKIETLKGKKLALYFSASRCTTRFSKNLASFSLHPPSLLNMSLMNVESKSRIRIPTTNPMLRTEGELKKIFKQHDANNDGLLSQAELKKAFRCIGSWIPGFRASNGIHHADANKDGQIDDQELNKLVEYAMQLGYTVKA